MKRVTIEVGSEGCRRRGARVASIGGERFEKIGIVSFDTSGVEPFRLLELRIDIAIEQRVSLKFLWAGGN
jgi:hypothetical protein